MEERGVGQTRHSRRGRMQDRVSVKASSFAHRISVIGDRGRYVGPLRPIVGRVCRVFTRPTAPATSVGLVKTRPTLPRGDWRAGRSL